MPKKQFNDFLEAVKDSIELQEKLKAAINEEDVVAIAKSVGFLISTNELKSIKAEISENELENVAGGGLGGGGVHNIDRKMTNYTDHLTYY